jgi:hypothetical protein
MLLVRSLASDTQLSRYIRPGPPQLSGPTHLRILQLVSQRSQAGGCPQPNPGILILGGHG